MAPPSTPAQPRFLPSKRQAPQSQQQRLNTTPLQAGPQQFASTPRFSVPAAAAAATTTTPGVRQPASHPPPLLFSTPGTAAARPRATQLEPLSDAIDTSPASSDTPRDGEGRAKHPLNESIEIDESPSGSRALPEEAGRPAKRRRVSISPEVEDTPEAAFEEKSMLVDDKPVGTPKSSPPYEAVLVPSPVSSEDHHHPTSDPEEPPPPEQPARQHPTFQPAPRFKVPEQPSLDGQRGRPAPLPEAFSPRRRGAKYVPGGLAAEVRDWLVQLKGASEYDRPAGAGVRAVVDEARAGEGMWIVAARHQGEGGTTTGVGGGGGDDGSGPSSAAARMVLAGDGRVAAGLGRRRMVRAGGTVAMHQPMWDVDLGELGQFAVACDWEVED